MHVNLEVDPAVIEQAARPDVRRNEPPPSWHEVARQQTVLLARIAEALERIADAKVPTAAALDRPF